MVELIQRGFKTKREAEEYGKMLDAASAGKCLLVGVTDEDMLSSLEPKVWFIYRESDYLE